MTFAFHLLIALFSGCFLGRYSEGFKNGMINQHMRFRRFLFPPLKGFEYIIQVKAVNQREAANDANLFLDIYGSKGTASKVKLGNLMTFNDFQSGKIDQFKVKLRDLGEIRKITLGHENNFARKPWYLERITIKAHDGGQYKFICNCTVKKIKNLFPEGKRPANVPAPGGCGGIFKDASHCWPFDNEIAEESPDLKGSSPAELEDGARIAESVGRLYVASTLEKGSWINMGNFKGKCISEPNLCKKGVTMIFWARIETSEISADPATSQYVFSSGGSDRQSQGFSFFHKNNSYVLQVVNGRKKWREEIPISRVPSDVWFSFAFTWSKAQGMRHFINGKPDGQAILQPADANIQHVNRFHGFRISKSNSNNNIEEMMPMKIDQFVTWGKILSETQILQAFKEGGEIPYNKGNDSNLQACNPSPCFNRGICKIDGDEPRGYRCNCPEGFTGPQCELNEEESKQVPSTAAPTSSAPTTIASPGINATTSVSSTAVPTTVGQTTAGVSSTSGTNATTAVTASTEGPTNTGGPTTAPVSTPATPLTGKATSPSGRSATPSTGPTSSSTTKRPATAGGSTVNPTSGESFTTAPTTKEPATTGEGTKSQTSATNATPPTAKPTSVGGRTKNPTTKVVSTSSPTTSGGSTNKPGSEGATSLPPSTSGVSPKNAPSTVPPVSGGPTTAGSRTAKPTAVGASKSAPTTPGASTTKTPTTAPPTAGGLTTAGGSTRKPIPGGKTTKMPTSPGASTNKSPTTAPPITGGLTKGGSSTGKPTVGGETTKPTSPGITTKTPPTAAPPTTVGPTTAGHSVKKPTSGVQTTAIPATLGGSTTKAPTTVTPTFKGPTTGSSSKSSESATTASPTTFKPTSAGSNTSSPTTIGASTATPTASGGSTRKATTIEGSRGKPTSKPTTGGETTAVTTVGGSTGIEGTTRKPTTVSTAPPKTTGVSTEGSTPAGAPTAGGGSKKLTTAGTTAAAPTTGPTLPGGSSKNPTSGGVRIGQTTTITTPAPVAQPVTLKIMLEIKILIDELIEEINDFRRLHQAPDVKPSERLNQAANRWANKIAKEGVERIDPNSNYGQLVCSHNSGGNTAKACVVKWYGAIKFFDWSNPKLTKKASPFTQLVWKNNSAIGIGVARGGGGIKKQNVGGKNFIVVLFEPGQNDAGDIKDNVLAATGISEPAPGAACPKGYSKVPQGSRSCFKVNTTPLSWDDAIYGCALDNGSLASLQSKEEADLVVSLIRASNESEAWIGLHDSSSEGRYVWLDGSAIPFSEWLQGEPNGTTSENCIIQSKGTFMSGWADRPCSEKKAFVCEVPVPGYTNYKLSFLMTEPQTHPHQNSAYTQPSYPGSYSMCLPYIQSGNELLKETIIRYFQTKNMFVQPVINTIRCMNNGSSFLEVTVKLGPGDVSQSVKSLQASIKENDGVLDLASGAKAKLLSVDILIPGVSYCPSHCTSTSCQPGCDHFCCIQSAAGQYPSQMPYQPPFQPQYQQLYQQPPYQPQQQQYHHPYQPQYQQPYSQPASQNNRELWQCPLACTRSGSQCPSYCSSRCCKKHLRIKIHRF